MVKIELLVKNVCVYGIIHSETTLHLIKTLLLDISVCVKTRCTYTAPLCLDQCNQRMILKVEMLCKSAIYRHEPD